MIAVMFYDVVVALHVLAIVIAFGITFAYPVLVPYVQREHPDALPALYGAMGEIGKKIITPAATVALVAGAYLATDRDLWSEVWVTIPLVILIAILGLGGAFFTPRERRLRELTARDVEAAGSGPVTWGPETAALSRQVAMVGALVSALIAVAIFFMVAKPFA